MPNNLHAHRFIDESSGYTAEALPDIITSPRRDFRPANVRVNPDVAIYMCDWYNSVIGHYQS
ncbi:MAG: hypothetical protein M2R45_01216 [Verrucomicrobia subdivision 3 bacterium]|nr:hypothetical protein [Limisphaerales bacterium]MCS1415232.1 hypothetical protein [Limisphaerales bacterium]